MQSSLTRNSRIAAAISMAAVGTGFGIAGAAVEGLVTAPPAGASQLCHAHATSPYSYGAPSGISFAGYVASCSSRYSSASAHMIAWKNYSGGWHNIANRTVHTGAGASFSAWVDTGCAGGTYKTEIQAHEHIRIYTFSQSAVKPTGGRHVVC